MQFVRLGSSGLKVSRLCLGTMTYGSSKWRPWVLDDEASRPFFRQAIEAGINFFDTADMSEDEREVLGQAVRLGKREDLVITTKIFYPMGKGPNDRGLSAQAHPRGHRRVLKRLGMDCVDLCQIRRYDSETPFEGDGGVERRRALRQGPLHQRFDMFAWQLSKMLAARTATAMRSSSRCRTTTACREEEREMLPFCRHEGIGVIPEPARPRPPRREAPRGPGRRHGAREERPTRASSTSTTTSVAGASSRPASAASAGPDRPRVLSAPVSPRRSSARRIEHLGTPWPRST